MALANPISCTGFPDGSTFMGACQINWLMATLLFFAIAVLSKQLADSESLPFNKWAAWIGALLLDLILIMTTKDVGLTFVITAIGAMVFGFFGSKIFGEDSSDDSGDAGGSEYG